MTVATFVGILDALEPTKVRDFRRVGKYKLPHVINREGRRVTYRRPSSAGKVLDDTSNLVDWQKCTALVGAAQRPDLMALVSTLSMANDRGQIRDYFEECLVSGKGTERRNTGTALHAMLDHVDRDDDWQPAPQFRGVIEAYKRALDIYGLIPVDIECQVINDDYKLAGTMDRRYRTTRNLVVPTGEIVPIGSIVGGDTKTGEKLEYASGSYATQLAAYVDGMRYNVDTDEREAFDPPTFKEWALIVHLVAADSRCDMYWIDCEAGRQGLQLSEAVRAWRDRTDLVTPARPPLRAVAPTPDSPASPAICPPEASTAPASTGTAVEPLAGLRAWLRCRIEEVRAAGDAATNALLREWPSGVPGLKYDTQTREQLDAISETLWKVEAEYALPFPPTFRHPRAELLEGWIANCLGMNWRDRRAIYVALAEFANLGEEWKDEEITEMLDGTLRAIGHDDGLLGLHSVTAADAPLITSSAFAIASGIAMVLYDEKSRPVVRTIESGK